MVAAVTSPPRIQLLLIVAGAVIAWFALSEVASQAWYAIHESKLPKNPVPLEGAGVLKKAHAFADEIGSGASEREIGSTAMDMLKCSYGETLTWSSFSGAMSALTVLKWDERSVVGGVESVHNPGICLHAAGWTVGDRTFLGVQNYCGVTCEVTKWAVSQGGQDMYAYSAVFRRYAETTAEVALPKFWNNTRLKSVISGRRDAPVMILLAYLPKESKSADERFEQIMHALFCGEQK